MEESTYQATGAQPIHPQQPSHSPPPASSVHQHPQPQDLAAHQQQGLVAVQELERQRLKSPQDLGARPPL
jgi:hypothetical protein